MRYRIEAGGVEEKRRGEERRGEREVRRLEERRE